MKTKYYLFMYLFSDINECTSNNGYCGQVCINTVGSYTCSCYSGYELNTDARTCAGMWSLFKLVLVFKNVTSVLHVIL